MTKLVAISDTHGQQPEIPECDILVHCGDFSDMVDHGLAHQKAYFYDEFLPWLKSLPAKHIVTVAGNHDSWAHTLYLTDTEWKLREALPSHIHYLRDNSVTINGLVIYGTPWVPTLVNWAFYLPANEAKVRYEMMPSGADIILSHGPPKGLCDSILEYGLTDPLGSQHLRDRIIETSPKYVFCGHIHSGKHEWEPVKMDLRTHVRNVAVLDERYKMKYEPFEMEI